MASFSGNGTAALGTVNFVNFTPPEGTFLPKVMVARGTITFITFAVPEGHPALPNPPRSAPIPDAMNKWT